MVRVEVTSGHIVHDQDIFQVGDSLEVSQERAKNWERLGVAKIVAEDEKVIPDPEPEPEAETVTPDPEPSSDPMTVEADPFVEPKKSKRGRPRKR